MFDFVLKWALTRIKSVRRWESQMMFAEALMKMREYGSAWAPGDLIWPLSIAIYIRKLAILEKKLLEHVTHCRGLRVV